MGSRWEPVVVGTMQGGQEDRHAQQQDSEQVRTLRNGGGRA